MTEDSSCSQTKYFTLSDVRDVFFGLRKRPGSDSTDWGLGLVLTPAVRPVPLQLSSTHADTNCPRADCVSSWTMVLIGMGVSYGVGTRVFVQ